MPKQVIEKPKLDLLAILERNFRFLKEIPLLPNIIDEQLKLFTLFFRPKVFGKMMHYVKTVKSWESITAKYHRYGGLEFLVNGQEIGHIHGNGLIDLHFNKAIAQALIDKQLAKPHHVLNQTGWISYYITKDDPIATVLTLTSWSYALKLKTITKEEILNQVLFSSR